MMVTRSRFTWRGRPTVKAMVSATSAAVSQVSCSRTEAIQALVAAFRFNAGSFVGDVDFDTLIAELLETSEPFRVLWARHEVRAKTSGTKAFRDARGEPLLLDWHTLLSSTASRQQLVYYTARPGSGDDARLAERTASRVRER